MTGRVGLRVLAMLLLVVEPLAFALSASSLLPRLIDRGAAALLLLAARVAVTALGIAAGLAILNDRPGAIPLARAALGGAAALVVVTSSSGLFPTTRPPGVEGPILAASLLYYAGWLAYLWRAARRA